MPRVLLPTRLVEKPRTLIPETILPRPRVGPNLSSPPIISPPLQAICMQDASFSAAISSMTESELVGFIPELARHRGLPLDQRYHQGEDSLSHALNAVAVLADIEGREEIVAGIKRGGTILEIAALLHDIGKTEPGVRVIHKARIEGEPEQISYYGHPQEGAKAARRILSEINAKLATEEQFSETEIDLICRLVEQHMEGLNLARELALRDPREQEVFMYTKARDFARAIAKGSMINHSIRIKDAILLALLLCEVEVRAGRSKDQENRLENYLKFRGYVEENIDRLTVEIEDSFLVPLTNGEDLVELGVPEKKRAEISRELVAEQKAGNLTSRQKAIEQIIASVVYQVKDHVVTMRIRCLDRERYIYNPVGLNSRMAGYDLSDLWSIFRKEENRVRKNFDLTALDDKDNWGGREVAGGSNRDEKVGSLLHPDQVAEIIENYLFKQITLNFEQLVKGARMPARDLAAYVACQIESHDHRASWEKIIKMLWPDKAEKIISETYELAHKRAKHGSAFAEHWEVLNRMEWEIEQKALGIYSSHLMNMGQPGRIPVPYEHLPWAVL